MTFRIGDSCYGLPAELVREVVEPGPVMTGLTGSGERRLDLMRVRDRWLPIVDLEGEGSSLEERPEAMVALLGKRRPRVGLLVDELSEVTSVNESESGRGSGVVEAGGELVRLIDPETMLTRSGKLFEEGEESMEERVEPTQRRRVVAFGIGGEEFGLDVMNVVEVLRVPEVREVPNAPEFVEGVVDVRESVVPIIDLRARFGVSRERRPVDERLLVSEGAHGRVGLVVDDVAGVVSIAEESISSPPEFFKGLAGRYLSGVARESDRLIILLDIDEILSSRERIALHEMLEATSSDEDLREDDLAERESPEGRSASTGGDAGTQGKRPARKKKRGGVKKGSRRREKAEE